MEKVTHFACPPLDINRLANMEWHFIHRRSRSPIYNYLLWDGITKHYNAKLAFAYEMSDWLVVDGDISAGQDTWDFLRDLTLKELEDNPKFMLDFMDLSYKLNQDIVDYLKSFSGQDFSAMENGQLADYFEGYANLALQASAFLIPPITIESHMEETLKKSLKGKFPERFEQAWQTVSTAAKQSPVQEEEIDALKLATKLKTGQDIELEVKKHVEDFAWLANPLYDGHFYSEGEVMEKIVHLAKENPESKLEKILVDQASHLSQLAQIKSSFKGDAQTLSLIDMLQEAIYFRSWRTERYYRNAYFLRDFYREIAQRLGLKKSEDVFYLVPSEIVDCLRFGKPADQSSIDERKQGFVMVADSKSTCIYSGQAVQEAKERIDYLKMKNANQEIKGQTAYPGIIKGKVCIVTSKNDFAKIIPGYILVTQSTTPDYVPILKKVIAIITDEGGVLSHASVISRELKIPCIIGTKIATKVLHDGDEVEVDATKGVVKIIKRA
ncbi:MAG: PEP-utilizing enzyme [Patescibacteria group bacterium]|jgi:phosphohistidine swiveling domain-containing protein